MDKEYLKGAIYGMELLGAKYIKSDYDSVYFEVPKESEAYKTEGALKRMSWIFKDQFSAKLKVKYTDNAVTSVPK